MEISRNIVGWSELVPNLNAEIIIYHFLVKYICNLEIFLTNMRITN
jgi:hypothetical protein